MSQFVELKKTDRKFEIIDFSDKIMQVLKDNIKDLVLYIKYDIEKTVVQISQILDDKNVIILTNPNYQPENNKMIVYGLLDKYIEMDLNVTETKGPGLFKCEIKKLKRAIEVRKELRLRVKPEQVLASNFIVSKHTIDVTNYRIPTSIKVLLDQFHTQNIHLSDIFKVNVFEENDVLLDKIRKTRKIFYLGDINNPDIYKSESEDIMDVHELLGELLPEYIRKYNERGYKSIIIAPVNYITDSGTEVAFAYTQLISKSKLFTVEDVQQIKDMLTKLVERIKDANTVLVQTEQQIINLSKSGAKLHITDERLKKYLKTNKGFVFNIVFKLQAPVTIYGEIKNLFTDDRGNLFAGIMFAGHSSRKDEMKRYYAFLDPIIKKYKEDLLKERKRYANQ